VVFGGHKDMRGMVSCDVGGKGGGLRHYGVNGLVGNIFGVTGHAGG
jgi:hypothetical protein